MRAKAVKLLMIVMLLSMFGSFGMTSHAEDEKPAKAAPKGADKKQTNINFEDELVEGELKKPELFYLLQKKQFNFKRLIKLREDFLPEMRRDADEIRRGRSKN